MNEGELHITHLIDQAGESVAGIASLVKRYRQELTEDDIPPDLIEILVTQFAGILLRALFPTSGTPDERSR